MLLLVLLELSDSIFSNLTGVAGLHFRATPEQMNVTLIAPSINRDQIKQSGVGVGRWKTASKQTRQQLVERYQFHAEPAGGLFGWTVTRVNANSHADSSKRGMRPCRACPGRAGPRPRAHGNRYGKPDRPRTAILGRALPESRAIPYKPLI